MFKHNIVHIEIPSHDMKVSGKFYSDLFGWEITPIPEMNYTTWDAGVAPGGGFNPLSDTVKAGDVLIYVDSQDIEADLKRAEQLGGKIIQTKMEIPQTGWFGVFQDPTGNTIALYTSMDPGFNRGVL
jgi:predicted enzyme related to lactoylglutathione lyase